MSDNSKERFKGKEAVVERSTSLPVLTNYDLFVSYEPRELANVLSWLNDKKTCDEWLDWLESPAKI